MEATMRFLTAIALIGGATLLLGETTAPVTFNQEVLPILQKELPNLSSAWPDRADVVFDVTQSTRPWAKAMKAAVLSRKMRRGSRTSAMDISPTTAV